MAAVLGVDLCKAIHLAISQLSTNFCGYAFQVVDLLLAEGQAFLLVVGFDVVDILQRFGLAVDGKHVLVEILVTVLQHRVVRSLLRLHFLEFLDADDALDAHVLGNLYGIGAPRRNHLAARANEMAFHHFFFDFLGVAEKPCEFGNGFLGKPVNGIDCDNLLIIRLEKANHKRKFYA